MRLAVAGLIVLAGCDLVFPPGKGGGDASLVGDDGPTGGDGRTDTPDAEPTTDAIAGCASLMPTCVGNLSIRTCGASCYALCDDPLAWDDAEAVCVGANAHLAAIPDTTANGCVTQILSLAAVTTAWVGLRQNDGASFPITGWHWIDGTLYTGFGWAMTVGEPNDGDGAENQDEQCGYAGTPGWGDFGCTAPSPFVCGQ